MNMPTVLAAFALALVSASVGAQDAPRGRPDSPPEAGQARAPEAKPDQAELEKQFEKTMSGATLVGRFTLERAGEGPDGGREPREERYHINKVTRTGGDNWVFAARIQYGGHDLTVPIMLEVKWAGDTPVITLTDRTIPGLGTYTARVMIYRDHYAGYWSGGDHGGNLWGRIEHDTPAAPGAPAAPDAPKPPAAPQPAR